MRLLVTGSSVPGQRQDPNDWAQGPAALTSQLQSTAAAAAESYGLSLASGSGGGKQKGVPDAHWISLFCAGDDDQSVYAWRGVTALETMRRFGVDFQGAEVRPMPSPLSLSASSASPRPYSPQLRTTHEITATFLTASFPL